MTKPIMSVFERSLSLWVTLCIVVVAPIIRNAILSSGGQPALDRLLARLGPVSLIALLTTLVQPWHPLAG